MVYYEKRFLDSHTHTHTQIKLHTHTFERRIDHIYARSFIFRREIKTKLKTLNKQLGKIYFCNQYYYIQYQLLLFYLSHWRLGLGSNHNRKMVTAGSGNIWLRLTDKRMYYFER